MDYWLANQYASLSYGFSKHWEAGANVMVTETKADNPGSVYLPQPLGVWAEMLRTTASLFVKNRYDITSGGIQAYYNWGKHDIDDGLRNGKPRDYLFHSKGKFINKGIEFDASYSIDSRWTATANYALLHTDALIVGAPKHKLFGEIAFAPGRWQFSLDLTGICGLHTEETTENYALLNAHASYTLPFRTPLTLFAKGENLTAARYQINYGFPMPKATVMAVLELRF